LTEHDIIRLAAVPAGRRILLLPHCLRHSDICQAKYSKAGLECAGCNADCAINRLRDAALRLGYGGVCVAPGGSLAVNYIRQIRPDGIVAVACQKELEEGVGSVGEIGADGYRPVIVVIPLTRDGCVDTEVELGPALEIVSAGCRGPS
jgi:geranylgeranyl diphosphate synthase type II